MGASENGVPKMLMVYQYIPVNVDIFFRHYPYSIMFIPTPSPTDPPHRHVIWMRLAVGVVAATQVESNQRTVSKATPDPPSPHFSRVDLIGGIHHQSIWVVECS